MSNRNGNINKKTGPCDDELNGCDKLIWWLSCCNASCYYVNYGDYPADQCVAYWCGKECPGCVGCCGKECPGCVGCCCLPCLLPCGCLGAFLRSCCLKQTNQEYCCHCSCNKLNH